jgi:hypothetical protein
MTVLGVRSGKAFPVIFEFFPVIANWVPCYPATTKWPGSADNTEVSLILRAQKQGEIRNFPVFFPVIG